MKSMVQRAATAVSVFAMTTLPAVAQQVEYYQFWYRPRPRPVAVPEIDASMGLLALAATGAALLFVWERRRRQA